MAGNIKFVQKRSESAILHQAHYHLINPPDLNLNFYPEHIDEKNTNGILADAL
jgi:hypothetical protein